MLRRYVQKKKVFQSPIPQFSHDPNFIVFRSWIAILCLKGTLPNETRQNDAILFLDEHADTCGTEKIPVKGNVCLRNPTRFAHLNVTIVDARSGQQMFFARELPAGRFLHLEFLREGSYALHYSPAFSQTTLHREIETFMPASLTRPLTRNFHPQLQSHLQTRVAGLNFNSPFPEYNSPRGLRVPKK